MFQNERKRAQFKKKVKSVWKMKENNSKSRKLVFRDMRIVLEFDFSTTTEKKIISKILKANQAEISYLVTKKVWNTKYSETPNLTKNFKNKTRRTIL